jgi:hypothetical protein
MEIDDLSNFQRAGGPIHTSLGQRPRTEDNNAIEGRRPDPSAGASLFVSLTTRLKHKAANDFQTSLEEAAQ